MARRAEFPTFMDPADRYPVGSADWSGRVSALLAYDFDRIETYGLKPLVERMSAALPGAPWRSWPPELPWKNRDVWCEQIFGLPWKRIVGMIEEVDPAAARELRLLGGAEDADDRNPMGGGANNPEGIGGKSGKGRSAVTDNIVIGDKPRRATVGNSADALLRRLEKRAAGKLKRTTPEQRDAARQALDGYRDGRHRSVRAAALAAGITKEPEPFRELCRWWDRASDEERRDFLRGIGAVFAGERRAA